jgi:hypothetical protein
LPSVAGKALNLSTLKRLDWFEVAAADVLTIWPRCVASAIAPLRPPGAPKSKSLAVEAEMRAMNPETLSGMKEKQMQHHFGASRATCRAARRRVIGN